jgi:hypothetical protein
MRIYGKKIFDYGFIILCSERRFNLLLSTANSIKNRYEKVPYICVTDDTAKAIDIKEMKTVCDTFKGKNTFSSLINTGIKNAKTDWNFIIFAGSTVGAKLNEKYEIFVEDEKDILFPIVDQKYDFVNGSLNGLFFHKKAMKEIGNIGEEGSLEFVKTMWAAKAIIKGYKFKAIANIKII